MTYTGLKILRFFLTRILESDNICFNKCKGVAPNQLIGYNNRHHELLLIPVM